jgi:hypothetical protein
MVVESHMRTILHKSESEGTGKIERGKSTFLLPIIKACSIFFVIYGWLPVRSNGL